MLFVMIYEQLRVGLPKGTVGVHMTKDFVKRGKKQS